MQPSEPIDTDTAAIDTAAIDTSVPIDVESADLRAVRWLSDAEMAAWRTYIETVGDLTAAIEADLVPTGLTLGDYRVLVHLSEAPDRRLRMCDLADVLQLSPSGLTRRLDGMVRSGWVRREGSERDRRVMLAVITDEGFRRLHEAAPDHVESVRRLIFDVLDDDQVNAMHEIFHAISLGIAALATDTQT